jgi:hypothetical protein
MALLVAVLPALSHPPVARAQVRPTVGATPDAPLRIESVSPWVEPDGEFQVRFAPTTAVPADARLTVTVHQSLGLDGPDGLRDEVLELVGGASPRRILQVPFTVDVATLGDPSTGAVLTVPIRSTRRASDRVLLPNPGIHPVRLELTPPARSCGRRWCSSTACRSASPARRCSRHRSRCGC